MQQRAIRAIDHVGQVQVANGAQITAACVYRAGTWLRLEIAAANGKFDLAVDGKTVVQQAAFAEAASSLERLSFRTGAYRTEPAYQRWLQARADRMRAAGKDVDLWK